MDDYIKRVPAYTREALDAFLREGRPGGHFLKAVITGDLFAAFSRADGDNVREMKSIVMYIYNKFPRIAFGSEEAYDYWLQLHQEGKVIWSEKEQRAYVDELKGCTTYEENC